MKDFLVSFFECNEQWKQKLPHKMNWENIYQHKKTVLQDVISSEVKKDERYVGKKKINNIIIESHFFCNCITMVMQFELDKQ